MANHSSDKDDRWFCANPLQTSQFQDGHVTRSWGFCARLPDDPLLPLASVVYGASDKDAGPQGAKTSEPKAMVRRFPAD